MSEIQAMAETAQRLLRDEAAQEVLAMMRAEAVHKWEQALTLEMREAAWHDQAAVARFENGLHALADRGVVEQIVEQRQKFI